LESADRTMAEKPIVRSVADSIVRLKDTEADVRSIADGREVSKSLRSLSKPNSPSSALRKAGVALIVGTPDPVTAVPGIALVAASYAAKRNDPSKLEDLATETRKILRDISSLSL